MKSIRFWFAVGAVFAAAACRLLPHPPNASPVAAMALFGGAYLAEKRSALLIPFLAMLLSDAVLGFHGLMPAVYGSFALTSLLGVSALRGRTSWLRIASATVGGSVLFFVITNLAVWFSGGYAQTVEGLSQCFTAALPFFRNSVCGDLFFSTVLFGAWKWAEARVPVFTERARA